MKASYFLGAHILPERKGLAVIDGCNSMKCVKVLGTSMECSINDDSTVGSFSVSQKEDEINGLIAVIAIELPEGRTLRKDVGFFILVDWSNENNPINLDQPFVPFKGRLGQIKDEMIQVMIDDELYATGHASVTKSNVNFNIVPGNLMCRYLVGLASPEDMKSAAVKYEKDVAAQDVIYEQQQEISTLSSTLNKAQENMQTFHEMTQDYATQLVLFRTATFVWYSRFRALGEEVHNKVFSFKLKALVDEIMQGSYDEVYRAEVYVVTGPALKLIEKNKEEHEEYYKKNNKQEN